MNSLNNGGTTHNRIPGGWRGMAPTDYPLAILSHFHRLARALKGEPIVPGLSLRTKFTQQAQTLAQVSGNHQLSLHYPWQISSDDLSEIFATGPVSGPNVSTWDMLNKPFT